MAERSGRASLLVAVGTVVSQAALMIVFALLARLLPSAELAAFRQIIVLQSVTLMAASFGVPTAMLYRIGRSRTDDERRRVYGTTLLWMFASTIAAGALTAILTGGAGRLLHSSTLVANTSVAALVGALAVHSIFIAPLLLSQRASGRYVVFATTVTSLTCALSWLFAVRDPRAHAALVAAAIANGAAWTATAILLAHAARPTSVREWIAGSRESLAYGVPIGVSSALFIVSYQIDHAIASRMFAPAGYAIYAAGAWQLPIGPVVQRAQADVLLPALSAHHAGGSAAEFWDEWRRVVAPFAVIGSVLFWGVFPMAGDLVRVLFGPGFEGSANVLRVYTLLLPLRMIAYTLPLRAAGRTTLDVVACIAFGLVNFAVGALVTPRIGLVGPATGVVAGYCAWVAVNLIGTARVLGANFRLIVPIRPIAIGFFAAAVASLPAWWVAVGWFRQGLPQLVVYAGLYGLAIGVIFFGVRKIRLIYA